VVAVSFFPHSPQSEEKVRKRIREWENKPEEIPFQVYEMAMHKEWQKNKDKVTKHEESKIQLYLNPLDFTHNILLEY
jgi:hypothetical protein